MKQCTSILRQVRPRCLFVAALSLVLSTVSVGAFAGTKHKLKRRGRSSRSAPGSKANTPDLTGRFVKNTLPKSVTPGVILRKVTVELENLNKNLSKGVPFHVELVWGPAYKMKRVCVENTTNVNKQMRLGKRLGVVKFTSRKATVTFKNVRVPKKIPNKWHAPTTTGTFSLVVNCSGMQRENNYKNNVVSRTVKVLQPEADLRVTKVFAKGKKLIVRLKNVGRGPLNSKARASVYADVFCPSFSRQGLVCQGKTGCEFPDQDFRRSSGKNYTDIVMSPPNCKGKAGLSVTKNCFGLKGVIKEVCYHSNKVYHFNLK